MTDPILRLTDGTTTIDFLDLNSGFILDDWQPNTPQYKDGGVWSDPVYVDGRTMVHKKFTNTIETIAIKARDVNVDALIGSVVALRDLLEKASSYFVVGWQDEPVWLEARSLGESNIRYAVVYAARVPQDNNPYSQPFASITCEAVMNGVDLLLERGHWQSDQPGTATCIQVSGQQGYDAGDNTVTEEPQASQDDASWNPGSGASYTTAFSFFDFGKTVSGNYNSCAIRFPTIAVAQGAIITQAYITFRASATQSNTDVVVRIRGELDNTDIGGFGLGYAGYLDATNRLANYGTVNSISWAIPATTSGSDYATADLTAIVQELVNQAAWASGDDMVFYVEVDTTGAEYGNYHHQFDSFDAGANVPELTVLWTTSTDTFGPAANCDDKVHVVGHQAFAQLTDVYNYDDSLTSYSSNLLGQALPYNLFPAGVANNDIIYFGSDTSHINGGPFSNVIFNVGTAATFSSAYILWEYYNGAWTTLTHNDSNHDQYSFDRVGTGGVFWQVPSDWTTTAINGVTGYWVRARAVITTSMSRPQLEDEHPYSVRWPRLDVASDQLTGDLPTLLRIKVRNSSDADYFAVLQPLHATRVLIGSRSTARGSDFSAYINISDTQLVDGISVQTIGTAIAFATDVTAPTGRVATGAITDAWLPRVKIALGESLAKHYFGKFRAFVRFNQSGGSAGDIFAQLVVGTSFMQLGTTEVRYSQDTTKFQIFDFGVVDIPGNAIFSSADDLNELVFLIYAQNSNTGAATVDFVDLILIPVDEWAGDFVSPFDTTFNILGITTTEDGKYLDIDEVLLPGKSRHLLRMVGAPSADSVAGVWNGNKNGVAALDTGRDQRLWFFFQLASALGDGMEVWVSNPEVACQVSLSGVKRYTSMRGGA